MAFSANIQIYLCNYHALELVKYIARFGMNRSLAVSYLICDQAGFATDRFEPHYKEAKAITETIDMIKSAPYGRVSHDLQLANQIVVQKDDNMMKDIARNAFSASMSRDIYYKLQEQARLKGAKSVGEYANKLLKRRLGAPVHPCIQAIFKQLHAEEYPEIPAPENLMSIMGLPETTAYLLDTEWCRKLYAEYLESYAG